MIYQWANVLGTSPYYTFGANNSVAIGYDTANYSAVDVGSSTPTTPATDDLCGSENSESGVKSWKMSFSMSDASKPVRPLGTIDVNGDGQITSADLVNDNGSNVALTGQQNDGVNFSDNSMSTFSPLPVEDDTTSPASNKLIGKDVCSFVTQTQENNAGNFSSKQICRRSHTGTWTEL